MQCTEKELSSGGWLNGTSRWGWRWRSSRRSRGWPCLPKRKWVSTLSGGFSWGSLSVEKFSKTISRYLYSSTRSTGTPWGRWWLRTSASSACWGRLLSFVLYRWCNLFHDGGERATGLRSLGCLGVLFLGIGMSVECSHRWETVLFSLGFHHLLWGTDECGLTRLRWAHGVAQPGAVVSVGSAEKEPRSLGARWLLLSMRMVFSAAVESWS